MGIKILLFLFSIEAGIMNGGIQNYSVIKDEYRFYNLDYAYYVDMKFDMQLFKFVFLQGEINNICYPVAGDILNFSPDHDVYTIAAGIRLAGFELAWRHRCYHPVCTYMHQSEYMYTFLEGCEDDIYLKFQGKVEL